MRGDEIRFFKFEFGAQHVASEVGYLERSIGRFYGP